MDIQHIINPQYSKRFLAEYHISTGLSIAIESREHFLLSKNRTKKFNSRKKFVEGEIKAFKDFTNVPDEILNSLSRKLNNRNDVLI